MNKNQTNPTIPLQRCVKCSELTGKFKDDWFDVGDGPLCESCFEELCNSCFEV